ncbi:hypothetical protein T10_5719 [Trichinella papuae]|uniref:Uncharacterized protein n=1 Tax=Trichinella papuae TaxID=268474 RepID=A0A0V1M291_9BILA|nr:hypothetical protein T10_5719 [Trichinella papuae]
MLCKLREINDVASVILLRLTGGVFAVYLQLTSQERSSVEKLGPEESPDVFLAVLSRLTALFGRASEKDLACAFVAGLSENVCLLLRSGS